MGAAACGIGIGLAIVVDSDGRAAESHGQPHTSEYRNMCDCIVLVAIQDMVRLCEELSHNDNNTSTEKKKT